MGQPPPSNVPSGCKLEPGQTRCPDVVIGDDVSLHLHNNGGSGDYYIEFWGQNGKVGGNEKINESKSVTILAGYDESLTYRLNAANTGPYYIVATVKVKSRPVNASIYSQSACAAVRFFGICP